MATTALQTENKPLDPKEMAKEVMKSTEDQAVMVSGMAHEELIFLVRSKNITIIQARGENYFDKEKENLIKAFLSETIHNLSKAKKNYLADKQVAAQDDLFRTLCSRGIHPAEAVKVAYPEGVPKPRE